MIAQIKAWFDQQLEDEAMNEKQLADRLRRLSKARQNDLELNKIADELDPPKPKHGKPIWFQQKPGGPWEFGMSHIDTNYSDDEVVLLSTDDGFTFEEIHAWKPARILGPRQVAVDVPPVAEWPEWANQIVAAYRNSGSGQNGIVTDIITRTKAERMEERDD